MDMPTSPASEQARRTPRAPAGNRALVLAAGGVAGALFEVGVLRALEERLGPPHEQFDVFIGVSAGASVVAFVAQGVLPTRLYGALLRGDDPLFPLRQRDIVSIDIRGAARLAATSGRLLASAAARVLRRGMTHIGEGKAATASLPPGLFSLDPYRRFLAAALEANGLTDDFRQLAARVLIPATDLDSGERLVLGAPPWDDVPISSAVAASSAIPVFFEPVPLHGRQLIDGDIGRAAHLDLVLASGAQEALIVSPLVPARNTRRRYGVPGEPRSRGSLRDRGMWTIYNQAHRIEHETRLRLGVERIRVEAPWLRLHIVESDRSDATLFLANPMSLDARADVLAKGYATGMRAFSTSPLTTARASSTVRRKAPAE